MLDGYNLCCTTHLYQNSLLSDIICGSSFTLVCAVNNIMEYKNEMKETKLSCLYIKESNYIKN